MCEIIFYFFSTKKNQKDKKIKTKKFKWNTRQNKKIKSVSAHCPGDDEFMPISSSSSKTTRGHCGSWGPNTPTQHVNINSKRRTTRGNKEPELVFGLWMMCGVAEDEKSHPTLCFCYYLDYWCILQHEWIVAHLVNCCVLYCCCSFSFLLLVASNRWIRRLTRSRALQNTVLFIWDTHFDPFNNVSLWAWHTRSGTTLPEALPSSHNDTHTHSHTHTRTQRHQQDIFKDGTQSGGLCCNSVLFCD